MKMLLKKRSFRFVIILIFTSTLLCAQLSAQGASQAALGTTSLSLEKICESLAARPNSKGDFTQIKTIKTNKRSLKSTGKFIISTYGIYWNTEKPFPTSLILTKNSMVLISANGTKSVMSGNDDQIFSNISNTLSSVFSGNVNALKENFECSFSDDGKGSWKIFLTPKDSTIASVMNSLELSGTYEGYDNNGKAKAAVLNSLEMIEASENTIQYLFSNQKYPEELSADEKQIFIVD